MGPVYVGCVKVTVLDTAMLAGTRSDVNATLAAPCGAADVR